MIQNGNFADGTTHWHGDGRTPADLAADNPLATPDPSLSKGMIIPLKATQWTKIAQDVNIKSPDAQLTITFQFSPGLTFSNKPDDYTGVPAHLGWGWKPFSGPPGAWMIDITDSEGIHGTHGFVNPDPKAKPGAPETYRTNMSKLYTGSGTALTLAFPPGTGTVTILSVSLVGK